MDIKKTFKNTALAVLNGVGAAYIPAVPATGLQQKSDNNNDQHIKQGDNYECSQ